MFHGAVARGCCPAARRASTSCRRLPPSLPLRRSAASTSTPPPASSAESLNLSAPRLSYAALLTPPGVEALLANAKLRNAAILPATIARASELAARRKEVLSLAYDTRSKTRDVGLRVRAKEDGALQAAKDLKVEIQQLEAESAAVERELLQLALTIPNATSAQTPAGPEANAVLLATLGPPPVEADANRDHLTLARALGLVDFKAAAKVTGADFYYLRGGLVVLEQALVSYALDAAMAHGFEASTCPDVVRTDIASRCGFVPRNRDGSSASYHLEAPPSSSGAPVPRLSLAATAEIPLAGQSYGTLFAEETLPRRTVGVGTAYRTEAGKGSDVRGLYRVHAFKKVELFVVCEEGRGESDAEMERLLALQQQIVKGLGLTVRCVARFRCTTRLRSTMTLLSAIRLLRPQGPGDAERGARRERVPQGRHGGLDAGQERLGRGASPSFPATRRT